MPKAIQKTLSDQELKLAQKIIQIAIRLHQKDFLAAADGNISLRLDSNRIIITPSGRHKAFIQPEDCAVITLQNEILYGNPSGERLMHLEVYKNCEHAQAVVHAHPPHAIAWSISHPELNELPNNVMSEVILAVGQIPIIPYQRPGSLEMGTALIPFLAHSRALILGRHGALSWGESLNEAYNGMERLEHSAKILAIAHSLGGIHPLPETEINTLKSMRRQLGEQTR